jgi:hypothetical protein
MKQPVLRRALTALPIFMLAAIAIVVSGHVVVGCGDDNCRTTRGGEVCD